MRLRAEGFQPRRDGALVGRIIALSDDGTPSRVEHQGNFSHNAGETLLRKLADDSLPVDTGRELLRQLLQRQKWGGKTSRNYPQPPA